MITQEFIDYFEQAVTAEGQKLIREFFITFSRFECAFKASNFVNERDGKVFANWDQFAGSIKETFLQDLTPDLTGAVNYIIKLPPRIQVLKDGKLDWDDRAFKPTDSLIIRLCLSIRDIRNNLFHGGKFNGNYQDDVSRNYILLKS